MINKKNLFAKLAGAALISGVVLTSSPQSLGSVRNYLDVSWKGYERCMVDINKSKRESEERFRQMEPKEKGSREIYYIKMLKRSSEKIHQLKRRYCSSIKPTGYAIN